LAGSFFWAGHWSLSSSLPTFPTAQHPVVFYTNQTGCNLHLLFLQALAQAKDSIYLEVYAITDPNVIQLLQAKVAQGLSVSILTDKKASPGLKKKLKSPPYLHFYKGRGLMHRKIVVIDHQLTLLGSTNFTPPSLTLHDNFALAISDEQVAFFFEHEAEEMRHFCLNQQQLDTWKLPKNGKQARKAIVDELAKANHSIQVAMFTLTDSSLSHALIAAHNRGIKVQVSLDYYTAGGSSKKIVEELLQAGISVHTSRGAQLFHHKWALIDETTLITGSTNWTKSAFTHNYDDFIIVHDLTEQQRKLMRSLWRTIANNTQQESLPKSFF